MTSIDIAGTPPSLVREELSMTKDVVLMRKVLLLVAACIAVMGAVTGPALAADDVSGGRDAGRAFELVSPPDKAGNDIDIVRTVQSATDGNAVAFSSTGAFAGAQTSVLGGYYTARRSENGWSTRGVDLPQRPSDVSVGYPTMYLSDDLSKGFQYSGLGLAPGAVGPVGENLYVHDLLTGARTLVAGTQDRTLNNELTSASIGRQLGGLALASGDFSHAVVQTSVQLLPEAPVGQLNLYESVDGHLHLVDVLPDGTVDPAGGYTAGQARSPRAMSADGSKIFFMTNSAFMQSSGLYVRINGTTTVPLSVSRRAGDPSTPVPASFAGASKDGNVVYFTSSSPLTDDAVGGELYKYDLRTDVLTNVMPVSDPGNASLSAYTMEVSEDGEYVYFYSAWKLTEDAPPPFFPSAPWNFYVAHAGSVKRIGAVAQQPPASTVAASPTGRFFAFATDSDIIPGVDHADPSCKASNSGNPDGVCLEVYVYDAVAGTTACVSCQPVDGRQGFSTLSGVLSQTISNYAPRLVSNDGHVFFQTPARLVGADTNGVEDVYEWDGQKPVLISSGRGSGAAHLADVSADGRDVFFFTAQRLVGADVDGAVDLYDARVGGGLSSQQAPAAGGVGCDGDACQGTLGSTPAPAPVASSDLSGPGDGPVPPGAAKKDAVKVTAPRSVKGTVVTVKVKAPGAGRVTVSGARAASVSRGASRAGTYSLHVAMTAKARRALRAARSHRLKVGMRVTFTPKSGASSSTTLTVIFRA